MARAASGPRPDPRAVQTDLVGSGLPETPSSVGNRSLVLFDAGDEITVQAGEAGIRFLLVSGQPLREPVAWYGPIVMNTNEEIRQAQVDLADGTFHRAVASSPRAHRARGRSHASI